MVKMKQILVINCGSSTIKYQLFDIENQISLYSNTLKNKHINDGAAGVIVHTLRDVKQFENGKHLIGVGHRVVHGGTYFNKAEICTDGVCAIIDSLQQLAPLHNPINLAGILNFKILLPTAPAVAVFDTAFHSTIPEYTHRYAVPNDWYETWGVRKYGFHGSSHKYVSQRALEFLNKSGNTKLITVHLGNGCSIAAIKNGICVDTSMGFTPLEGLMMGTRCGDVDPSIVNHISHELMISTEETEVLLNKESGLKGICGKSDMVEILSLEEQGDEKAKLAVDMFCYKIVKQIGSYIAALNGIDCLVFTGGIGENSSTIRNRICDQLSFFGIRTSKVAEKGSTQDAPFEDIIKLNFNKKPSVLVIKTNEELQIAKETYELLK